MKANLTIDSSSVSSSSSLIHHVAVPDRVACFTYLDFLRYGSSVASIEASGLPTSYICFMVLVWHDHRSNM